MKNKELKNPEYAYPYMPMTNFFDDYQTASRHYDEWMEQDVNDEVDDPSTVYE